MHLADQDKNWQEYILKIQNGLNDSFEQQWKMYNDIFSSRFNKDLPAFAWLPSDELIKQSNLGTFIKKQGFSDYNSMHQWSVENRAAFWQEVVSILDIRFKQNPKAILDDSKGAADPVWLSGAKLNIVESCFNAEPDSTAIISASENDGQLKKTSYAELNTLVNRFANGLVENGFRPGDRIVLYMPMTSECVAAYLGIIKAGCQVISVADSFSAEELKRRMNIANAKAIICVDYYIRGGKKINLYPKVKDANAPVAVVINTDDKLDLRQNDILWQDFLSSKREFQARYFNPYTPINILFSSGTTADPKAIPWTHLTPIKSAMDGHFHQDIRQNDVVAWPTNIGWMMGPWLIFASLLNQASIALFEGTPAGKGFVEFVKNARVTMLGVIPSLVRSWHNDNNPDMDKWKNIRVFSSTGEPSNRFDYLWLMSRTRYRAPVIEYLGGTEIGGGHLTGTVLQPASPSTFTTPALGINFVLLDGDNKPVKEGQTGELFLIPPAIGLSQTLLNRDHNEVYYKDCPALKGTVLRRHGDEIAALPGGYYKAHGRADDSMNLGGIKVSSVELEQVVAHHPDIFECAAVSVQPQGEGQEKLLVFAVTEKENIEKEKLKRDLNKLISEKLNPLFKIFDLIFIEELPRTASNKLMRRKLREKYTHQSGG